jgi:hypothetical protein
VADHLRYPRPAPYADVPSTDHHPDEEEGVHDQQHHHGGNHDGFLAIPSAQGCPLSLCQAHRRSSVTMMAQWSLRASAS